jgi:hypothetical protein
VVDGDEAIAWCEYGTPEELPTIHHRKQYEAECDVLPDYRGRALRPYPVHLERPARALPTLLGT